MLLLSNLAYAELSDFNFYGGPSYEVAVVYGGEYEGNKSPMTIGVSYQEEGSDWAYFLEGKTSDGINSLLFGWELIPRDAISSSYTSGGYRYTTTYSGKDINASGDIIWSGYRLGFKIDNYDTSYEETQSGTWMTVTKYRKKTSIAFVAGQELFNYRSQYIYFTLLYYDLYVGTAFTGMSMGTRLGISF